MKNFKYIILAIIGVMLVTSSCSDGKEIDKTLEIDLVENTLKVDNSTQTKTIPIKVDRGSLFTATWDGEDWGRVEVKGDAIEITVDTNTSLNPRSASVIVTLEGGWKSRAMSVIQGAAQDSELSVLPDEIEFDFMGGEAQIDVTSLSDTWTVKFDAAWLKVTPHVKTGKILVWVEKNSGTKESDVFARSTVITVNSGTSSKEIIVAQEEGLYFTLPYENYNDFSTEKIEAFELARYSTISVTSMTYQTVATQSPLFNIMRYYERGTEALLAPGYTHAYFETEEFNRLFTQNGYEFLGISNGLYYWWKELAGGENSALCIIRADKPGMLTFFSRTEKPEIAPDAPTFDEFPYLDPVFSWGVLKPVVKGWEEANGGLLNNETETQLDYLVVGSDVHYARIYAFDAISAGGGFSIALYAFKEVEKMLTTVLAGAVINKNFDKLIKDEGFKYMGQDQNGFYIYSSVEKDLTIIIGLATAEGIKLGTINYLKYTEFTSGVSPQLTPYANFTTLKGFSLSLDLGKPMVLRGK